jgi:hypothetical protein
MKTRYQITTFDKPSQFSRVADQSILAGLTGAQVRRNWTDHLSASDALRVSCDLAKRGVTTYRDKDGRLARIKVYTL